MEDYQPGDKGIAIFKCGKNKYRITAYGEIVVVDEQTVRFRDDFTEHIINREEFEFKKV